MSSRTRRRLPGVRRATPDDDAVADDGCLVLRLQAPVPGRVVQRLCRLVREPDAAGGSRAVVCEVRAPVDLSVVEALARLQLTAQRLQQQVRLRPVEQGLRAAELLVLCGLTGVVPWESEPGRQPEAREQRGIEEVVDVRHPPP